MTTIWFAHCSQLNRETVSDVLTHQGIGHVNTWETVEAASDQLQKVKDLDGTVPDLIMVDLKALRSKAWALKLFSETSTKVVITADELHLYDLRIGLRFDVAGYILYSLSPEAFGLSLRLVLGGERVFPPELANLLTSGKGAHGLDKPASAINGMDRPVVSDNGADTLDDQNAVLPALLGFSDLNPLNVQILSQLVDGCTNKQIAISLGISEEMVKLHLMQIMRKINVKNRTQAALWTVQSGICRGIAGTDGVTAPDCPVGTTA